MSEHINLTDDLTDDEFDVLAVFVVSRLKNREIAECLGMTVSAVKHHMTNLFRKFGVRSRTELVITILRDAERAS